MGGQRARRQNQRAFRSDGIVLWAVRRSSFRRRVSHGGDRRVGTGPCEASQPLRCHQYRVEGGILSVSQSRTQPICRGKHMRTRCNTFLPTRCCCIEMFHCSASITLEYAQTHHCPLVRHSRAIFRQEQTLIPHTHTHAFAPTHKQKQLSEHYTDELIKLIGERYKADFELFGYDNTNPFV